MARSVRPLHPGPKKMGVAPFSDLPDLFCFHRALAEVVRAVGEKMEKAEHSTWEGQSLSGDHVCSRNDLEATAYIIQSVAEVLGRMGLKVDVNFENEEIPLIPLRYANGRRLRLVFDPIDGSKAFDMWKAAGDCQRPRPGSAISIAAACPVVGEIVSSALYCFDRREVFSSVYLGQGHDGGPNYVAFRNGRLLHPSSHAFAGESAMEAARRVLCAAYNSEALEDIARLELALMKMGLKGAYGGLTGSSATDIINVVRGSFCVCVDVRALCGKEGSVPYWYDVAGALPVARGRGLSVIVTDSHGLPLQGGNHDIYTPVAFVVARPGLEEIVIDAIRMTVCPDFLREGAPQPPTAER